MLNLKYTWLHGRQILSDPGGHTQDNRAKLWIRFMVCDLRFLVECRWFWGVCPVGIELRRTEVEQREGVGEVKRAIATEVLWSVTYTVGFAVFSAEAWHDLLTVILRNCPRLPHTCYGPICIPTDGSEAHNLLNQELSRQLCLLRFCSMACTNVPENNLRRIRPPDCEPSRYRLGLYLVESSAGCSGESVAARS